MWTPPRRPHCSGGSITIRSCSSSRTPGTSRSARALAALPGCRAVATTSAAVARSLGFEDGEQAPAEEMLRAAERIAAAVDVPVTADLERGYGDPVGTARAAWAAGVVGLNVEDSTGGRLVPVEEQAEVIRAIRAAVPELVVNARIDVFIRNDGWGGRSRRTRRRLPGGGGRLCLPDPLPDGRDRRTGRADRRAGQRRRRAWTAVRRRELERLGVARLTWGPGLATAAYGEAARIAGAALAESSRS